MKQQRLRRENQVTLYRKYRIGDLPDIQINYSYIIAPLQALAHVSKKTKQKINKKKSLRISSFLYSLRYMLVLKTVGPFT